MFLENDSEKIQQILFNPKSRIMERIRRFEADMKKFGNPNNPKEKLNLNEIPSDMVTYFVMWILGSNQSKRCIYYGTQIWTCWA